MLQGSFVALVTPFKKGEIDYLALEKLIDFQLANQTDGIVLLGTTAETSALASDEKTALLRFAIQHIGKRVPVVVGTGTYNLNITLSQTMKAKELGADYALVVVPYYIKPTQNGMYEYFKAIADKVDIPIIVYNIPGRCGANMLPATLVRLANDCPNIVGVKEASTNLIQASEMVRDLPPHFSVLSGEDGLNFPIMACGGKGTISVTANVVPKLMHELIAAGLNGDFKSGIDKHLYLTKLNNHLFLETNPIPVKEALHLMGMIEREFRLPMCKMMDGTYATLKQTLAEYGLIPSA